MESSTPDRLFDSTDIQLALREKLISLPEKHGAIKLIFNRIQFRTSDLIHGNLLPAIGWGLYAYSIIFRISRNKKHELAYLLKANRTHQTITFMDHIKNLVSTSHPTLKHLVSNPVPEEYAIRRTIILKMPKWINNVLSKGILLITFTETFSYYLKYLNINDLSAYFYIVIEPSWAGYSDPDILAWDECGSVVIVEATERKDREFLTHLGGNLKPVSFGASDWVNYRMFRPIGADKQYDAVCIANYKPGKRLHAYLDALRKLKAQRSDIKAALVCASWGSVKNQILSLAKSYSLDTLLDIYEDLNQEEVNYVLNISKVNILLSLKEGSNRALFEGMFAGTPAILLDKNIGANKDYINEKTGKLIREKQLADSIIHFKNSWRSYDPRSWAMNNISPEKTTGKLVAAINYFDNNATLLNDDIATKVNQPEVSYFSADLDKDDLVKNVLDIFSIKQQGHLNPRDFLVENQFILDDVEN